MKNILLTTLLILIKSICYSQNTEPIPIDGRQYIAQLFEEKPLVAIGEIHGHQQLYDFLNQLILTPEIHHHVNDIVIEAGNALYQPLLDDYIFGKDASKTDLEKLWLNTTQSPVDPWRHSNYEKLLQTVKELNQGLSEHDKIRVIAADPKIDWSEINTLEEYESARGNRNEFYSQIVINEVLTKGRKALLIAGGAHFGKHESPDKFINQRIEERYPNSVVVIQAPAGLGPSNSSLENKLSSWPQGTITAIKGTWIGELSGFSRMPIPATSDSNSNPAPVAIRRPPSSDLTKEMMYDYLLYFGPFNSVVYTELNNQPLISDEFWKELDRRSMIRFNNPLIPESRQTGELRPTAYN